MDMIDQIVEPDFLIALLVTFCVGATLLTLSATLFPADTLSIRMKSVASERQRLKALGMEEKTNTRQLRYQQQRLIKDMVEKFSLSQWLYAEDAKARLASAGFRGPQAESTFLFSRLLSPLVFSCCAIVYTSVFASSDMSLSIKAIIILAALYLGIKAPEIYLKNTTIKRQESMRRALPDALDLLLICVESGMSIEHAFRRVSMEIGMQSVELAEELALTTAELSYLSERRTAYSNLAARTGLDGVKQISTSLIQAEKYGTPLGQAMRVTARDIRDQRMAEAEKKGAALPPKLTVPMILFFLPVLIAVILGPAILSAMKNINGG